LARWFALKTLVNECAYEGEPAIPPSDHSIIRHDKKLPRHWQIWVAYSDRFRDPGTSYNSASRPSEAKRGRDNAAATTLIMGRLVAFVIVSPAIRYAANFVPLGDLLQPIHPHGISIHWPPKKYLDDGGLLYLTQCLNIATEGFTFRWDQHR
jgi:hypothetical protein